MSVALDGTYQRWAKAWIASGERARTASGMPAAGRRTAREVGTFAHRLPADMVVMNDIHREICETAWGIPEGTIPPKPGYHAVLQNRMLKDGKPEPVAYFNIGGKDFEAL